MHGSATVDPLLGLTVAEHHHRVNPRSTAVPSPAMDDRTPELDAARISVGPLLDWLDRRMVEAETDFERDGDRLHLGRVIGFEIINNKVRELGVIASEPDPPLNP